MAVYFNRNSADITGETENTTTCLHSDIVFTNITEVLCKKTLTT